MSGKISFSLGGGSGAARTSTGNGSASASSSASRPAGRSVLAEEEEAVEEREYVTGLSGSRIQSTRPTVKKAPLVIPLPASARQQPSAAPAAAAPAGSGAGAAAGDAGGDNAKDDGTAKRELTLDEQAAQQLREGAFPAAAVAVSAATAAGAPNHHSSLPPPRPLRTELSGGQRSDGGGAAALEAIPMLMRSRPADVQQAADDEERYRLDMANRPPEATMADYEQTPISQFGAAMLRGMGWKEGQAIGGTNKGLVEPIEFIRRPQGLGLGGTRDAALLPGKRKPRRYIRPGETRDDPRGQQELVATDADGRVRHVKGLSEKAEQRERVGLFRDCYAILVAGAHRGHCCRIRRVEPGTVQVVLDVSDAIVTARESDVRPLPKAEYRRLQQLPRRERLADGEDGGGSSNRSSSHERSSSSDRKRSADRSDRDHDRHRDRNSSSAAAAASSSAAPSAKRAALDPDSFWLHKNLRVRIVSDRYAGGKYYNQKV